MTTNNTSLQGIGPVALVGAGKMGGAMLDGWLALGLDPKSVLVVDPKPSPEIQTLAGQGVTLNPAKGALSKVRVVILAVKPQVAAEVLPDLSGLIGADTLVVSIMAGKTLAFLDRVWPRSTTGASSAPATTRSTFSSRASGATTRCRSPGWVNWRPCIWPAPST